MKRLMSVSVRILCSAIGVQKLGQPVPDSNFSCERNKAFPQQTHRYAAYLILLDQRGVVRWRQGGMFDEQAYRTLSKSVSELLGERR